MLDSTATDISGSGKMLYIISLVSSWKPASNSNFSFPTLYLSDGLFVHDLTPMVTKSRASETAFLVGVLGRSGLSGCPYLRGLFKEMEYTWRGATSTWCTLPNPAALVRPFAPW